jgi:hypothetical protein
MEPAKVTIAGPGLPVEDAISHPPGLLYSGGYDADRNELYLSSVMGHPRGVAVAGGDPSNEHVSGLRVLVVRAGNVFWSTDSMSLPRGLSEEESIAVQDGLNLYFQDKFVNRVEKLEDIPR